MRSLREPVVFETIADGFTSGSGVRHDGLITTAQAWESLWNLVSAPVIPKPPLPEMDWTDEMI
jgi:hypothetical protein